MGSKFEANHDYTHYPSKAAAIHSSKRFGFSAFDEVMNNHGDVAVVISVENEIPSIEAYTPLISNKDHFDLRHAYISACDLPSSIADTPYASLFSKCVQTNQPIPIVPSVDPLKPGRPQIPT